MTGQSAEFVLPLAITALRQRVAADAALGAVPDFDLVVDPGFDGVHTDGPASVVARVGLRRFSAGLEHGLEIACAKVMSALQDEAVDGTGRPWPEVVDPHGRSLGVLDVAADPPGIAVWRLRGVDLCAVGLLGPSCAARGWSIR